MSAGADATAEFTLCSGQSASFAFGNLAKAEVEPGNLLDPDEIDRQFHATSKFWRDWMHQSNYQGRWREVVNRSALVLKLLTSREHGSLIAAATFGLPEQPGGSRNWDYRFTWLRDSSFTLYAFMRLGFTGEARSQFTQWLRERLTDGLNQDSPERLANTGDPPVSRRINLPSDHGSSHAKPTPHEVPASRGKGARPAGQVFASKQKAMRRKQS